MVAGNLKEIEGNNWFESRFTSWLPNCVEGCNLSMRPLIVPG